jgi:hypothetical protein
MTAIRPTFLRRSVPRDFVAGTPHTGSAASRLHVIAGGEGKVKFCVSNGRVLRVAGEGEARDRSGQKIFAFPEASLDGDG